MTFLNILRYFFPESASEGFLLCRSSAGAELSFPGRLRVRCRCVAGALRVRSRRIENLYFSMKIKVFGLGALIFWERSIFGQKKTPLRGNAAP